jgi:hypothetical protein
MGISNGRIGVARKERLQFMLSPEELTVVDNFRFDYRMPSRIDTRVAGSKKARTGK